MPTHILDTSDRNVDAHRITHRLERPLVATNARPAPARRRHATLTEYVLEELRQRIVLGQLAPGTRLDADLLASELGSSRIPVREALRQLEAEGLVVNRPRRSVQVREMRLQDVDEAYDLLEFAEDLALAKAVKCITPEAIESMRHWASELKRLEDSDEPAQTLIAHRSFHFTLFEALGDGPLLRHLRMLWHSCERYLVAAMRDQPDTHASAHGHEDFIELLASNAPLSAIQKELRLHLRASRERAKSALRDQLASDAE